MKSEEQLQREMADKLRRLDDLRQRRPKKHCGHKEYSNAEDVDTAVEIERLQDDVSKLRQEIARQQKA